MFALFWPLWSGEGGTKQRWLGIYGALADINSSLISGTVCRSIFSHWLRCRHIQTAVRKLTSYKLFMFCQKYRNPLLLKSRGSHKHKCCLTASRTQFNSILIMSTHFIIFNFWFSVEWIYKDKVHSTFCASHHAEKGFSRKWPNVCILCLAGSRVLTEISIVLFIVELFQKGHLSQFCWIFCWPQVSPGRRLRARLRVIDPGTAAATQPLCATPVLFVSGDSLAIAGVVCQHQPILSANPPFIP